MASNTVQGRHHQPESRSRSRSEPAALSFFLHPFRLTFGVIGYLGRLAMLATSAVRATVRPVGPASSFVGETTKQLDRLLSMGLPLVGLVHVGMGSFLSMQAYFGATFVDGIGPVTGVGLIRNLAPLLSGFIMAGVIAACNVAELSDLEPDESSVEPSRLVAARLLAAVIAGPTLAVWGSLVGIASGWLIANIMMGVTLPAFFDMFLEMLWVRDIVGLLVKGSAFGFMAALLACQEGLSREHHHREPIDDHEREPVGSAACRAACLAGLAILAFNSAWFMLVYHAGPAFGPTVLAPPGG